MSSVMKSLEKLPFFKTAIIRIRNKQQLHGNECALLNIHSVRNHINMLGCGHALRSVSSACLRACNIHVEGKNNSIEIAQGTSLYGEGANTAYISGSGNRVIIGSNCMLRKASFFIRGNNNTIIIGDGCSAYNVQFHIEQDGNAIYVGDGTTFHGRDAQAVHLAADEGSRILIGNDCMFAHSTQIRSTDSHSIIDDSGKRINPAKDVVIGNHCWIGLQCIILKGVELADRCVVAAGAVCSKKYEESNCVIGGNPARVIKRNIDWDRKFL